MMLSEGLSPSPLDDAEIKLGAYPEDSRIYQKAQSLRSLHGCANKDCKLFDVAVPVSNLYVNRTAPLYGPWPCPGCGEEMKIAFVIPNSYKGNSSKTMPKRMATSQSVSRTVGKKPARRKSVKRKVVYPGMGKAAPSLFKKQKPKSTGRKQGPRKRG